MTDAIQMPRYRLLRDGAGDTLLVYPSLSLSVSSACSALDIARSTFYRYQDYDPCADSDTDLRDRIQKIALDWPSYGYRRITAELNRHGRVRLTASSFCA